jgi:hypothetical protein
MVRRCPAVFHSKIFGHTPHLLGIRWAFPSNSPVMPVVAGDLPPKARPLHTCAGSPVHTGIDLEPAAELGHPKAQAPLPRARGSTGMGAADVLPVVPVYKFRPHHT